MLKLSDKIIYFFDYKLYKCILHKKRREIQFIHDKCEKMGR